jgi:cobalt-precorrin 5A hydrolase/precorrin-3B C17-methyltransferase
MRPAIVILGPSALELGRRIAVAVDGDLHGFGPRVSEGVVAFAATAEHLRTLFVQGRPIVGVCAAGVLIRALAPLLADKRVEPAVVAVAEDGSVAVPLLGGHHGANDLARRIAGTTGGKAAITTAGDLRHDIALDVPPLGWRLGNPEAAKAVMASLLAGEPVALKNETSVDATWLAALPWAEEATQRVVVTERLYASPNDLLLHPATIALGVGCERLMPADELIALAEESLSAAGLSLLSVACVASIALKAAEPAVK